MVRGGYPEVSPSSRLPTVSNDSPSVSFFPGSSLSVFISDILTMHLRPSRSLCGPFSFRQREGTSPSFLFLSDPVFLRFSRSPRASLPQACTAVLRAVLVPIRGSRPRLSHSYSRGSLGARGKIRQVVVRSPSPETRDVPLRLAAPFIRAGILHVYVCLYTRSCTRVCTRCKCASR